MITFVSIIPSPIIVANLNMTGRCPNNLAQVTVFLQKYDSSTKVQR